MAIKTNIKVFPVSWLKELNSEGKLNKDISLQRNEVWNVLMKSNFIVSLLMDVPIESLLFERVGEEEYNVLDGKQRTITLCSFVNDEFALSPKIEVEEVGGVSLAKQKFFDLPDKLRNKILNYQLSFAIMEPLTEEQRERVFYMRNQSVHLSKMDLSRVVLGKKERELLTKICGHSFMQDKIIMTKKARQNHDDLKVLLQFLMLKLKPDTGFSAPEIMGFCQELKNKTQTIPEKDVKATLDYLDKALAEKFVFLKKIHLPSIMWLADVARIHNLDPENFGLRVFNFVEALYPEHPYSIACHSGRSKKPDVQARLKAMSDVLADLEYEEIKNIRN